MKKIIMVSTNNTCRSFIAESILRQYLLDADQKNVEVISRGLVVLFPEPVHVKAADMVIKTCGIESLDFRSAQLTQEEVDKAIDGGDNNDWLYLKRFEAFYNLGRYYSARMSLNEDILKNPTPKWVMHGKVAMMMRFKGYPFYLIHDGHVKVSRPFNVGGYRAHYKLKELAYNERMVYFRKFIKWNRGCE